VPVDLVIAPEAELDIAEAYVWYEGRRSGLGEEFLSSVDACIESVRPGSAEGWLVQQAQYDLAHVRADQMKLKRLELV
jgi:hypothetical protein